jgi:O-antigen/teichoic acid export membrane protein
MNKASPSVAKTVLATLSGEVMGRAALLGLNFFVANRLGAGQYGQMGVLLAAASMLQPLADLGLTHLALRTLSEVGGEHRFPLFLAFKSSGSLLFFLVLAVWSRFLGVEVSVVGFFLAGVFVLLNTWGDYFRQILRARQLAVVESWMRLVFIAGACTGAVLMATLNPTPTLALVCISIAPLSLCVGYGLALVWSGLPSLPSLMGAESFLRQNGVVALGSMAYLLLVVSIMRLDVWMVHHFLGTTATGAWLSAYNLVYAGAFLAQGLASVAIPRLMDPTTSAPRVLWKVWRLQIGLAVGLFLGVQALGPRVFQLVFRSPDFQMAVQVVPLLGGMLAISTLVVLSYFLFLVAGRLWSFLLLLALAVCVKICLGFILVPRFGLQGVAWSGLLSEGPELAVAAWWGSKLYLDWRRKTAV